MKITALITALVCLPIGLSAASLAAPFNASYSAFDLGSVPGVTGSAGGITFKSGDSNTLLIGANANQAGGQIMQIAVTRDASGHITGFNGNASFFASAPYIDGGLDYGPGGVLFYTQYPSNRLGEIKPGSTTTDKTIDLSSSVTGSVGTLMFVGNELKIGSYGGGGWYTGTLSADGNGTYNVSPIIAGTNTGHGPEGIIYVPTGSPQFTNPSVLVSEYSVGQISAYQVDSNGDPIAATRQAFYTGLSGAEGAVLDPVTNDFLFATFGSGNHLVVVEGFAAPSAVPEPSSMAMLLGGLALAGWMRRLRRN